MVYRFYCMALFHSQTRRHMIKGNNLNINCCGEKPEFLTPSQQTEEWRKGHLNVSLCMRMHISVNLVKRWQNKLWAVLSFTEYALLTRWHYDLLQNAMNQRPIGGKFMGENMGSRSQNILYRLRIKWPCDTLESQYHMSTQFRSHPFSMYSEVL